MGPAPAAESLLERHRPVLRYDSQEVYFSDSAAEWTDNPGNELVRGTGEVVATADAAPPQAALSLDLLGSYPGPTPEDFVVDPGGDYQREYAALRVSGDYRRRIYGRVAADRDGSEWLQYWFFYFYNDAGFLGFGAHEGDWEMVQLRLGDGGEPDFAVYAQHKHAQARPWVGVERHPELAGRPVVYPARGSHASYFEPGLHWATVWFDHADGKGFEREHRLVVVGDDPPAWMLWPGRWGGTKATNPAESDSPASPGRHPAWDDPLTLHEVPRPPAPAAKPPAAPAVDARRVGDRLEVAYALPEPRPDEPAATTLVVHLNSPDDPLPPQAHAIPIAGPSGSVSPPVAIDPAKRYEVTVSAGNELGGGDTTATSV
jgi:hypothetical protein